VNDGKLAVSLPPQLLVALENLGRKKAGLEVDWINIADARALTDLGLAERTQSGWVITAAGAAALEALGAAPTGSPPDRGR
jgi:hypothetical protein